MDGIGDHEAVLVKSLVTAYLSHPNERIIYLWSQADFQDIRNRISLLCEEFISSYSTSTPIEILWINFTSICNTCLDLIPIKLCSHNSKQPWINIHIKRLSRRKERAYNQAHNTNESQHWTRYYNLKRECQWECHIAYNKYVFNLVDPNKNIVTKKLWTDLH